MVGTLLDHTSTAICYTAGVINLIVTHKSPDLDAITSVWLFQRFDAQNMAQAKVAFVNPGETISPHMAEQFGALPHEVIHVDTGLGEFDHHQEDRGQQYLSAAKLVYEHLCHQHPELAADKALSYLVGHVTDIDQYAQVNWPESKTPRSRFTIEELISGFTLLPNFDDERMVETGKSLLDSAYASLGLFLEAAEELKSAETIALKQGYCVGVLASNDYVIDVAQMQGAGMVVKKDPELGNIRIKCRPDFPDSLARLRDAILERDKEGTWYYHPSGKMLLNGSTKKPDQKPSPLQLHDILSLVKELYS